MTELKISISEYSEDQLHQLAKEQGKTLSEVLEEIIEFYYLNSRKKKQPKCLGKGKSHFSNLSERVDELLWKD